MSEIILREFVIDPGQQITECQTQIEPDLETQAIEALGLLAITYSKPHASVLTITNLISKPVPVALRYKASEIIGTWPQEDHHG
jgi:hypothetical protein